MRKEVLRLERVTVEENDFLLLDNFSLHVFEGEIFGLVCFNFHGRDALLRLLERNEPLHYGFVYLGEKLVNAYGKSDMSYNKVLFIDSTGGLADSLTVAENIFVLRYGFRKRLVSRRVLEKQVEILSRETGIPVEPGRYVAELSFYEKCCVALLKAYATGAKLVVVRDISHFLSTADLREFQKQMRKLADRGISFLYMCSQYEEIFPNCDRAAIMEDGRIRKVLDASQIGNQTIRAYHAPFHQQLLELKRREHKGAEEEDKNCLLRFRAVCRGHIRNASFSLAEGESLALQDTDIMAVQELMQLLAGAIRPASGDILFDRAPLKSGAATRPDIAFISENPAETMIWPELSVLDNLCFSADHKLPAVWRSRRIRESIRHEFVGLFSEECFRTDVMRLPVRTRIDIVYQRVLLQRPRLVVCMQPFAQADLYMRGHILSWLNRLREENITLLLLTVNRLSALHVVDRLLIAEHGEIQGELRKAEVERMLYESER